MRSHSTGGLDASRLRSVGDLVMVISRSSFNLIYKTLVYLYVLQFWSSFLFVSIFTDMEDGLLKKSNKASLILMLIIFIVNCLQ